MRSTVDIIVAVKECQPATEEELRLALVAMSAIEHFVRTDLQKLIDAVEEGKPAGVIEIKAAFAKGTISRMFKAIKMPVDKWLGPGNTPGTPENTKRLAMAKKIFKRATGLDLDPE